MPISGYRCPTTPRIVLRLSIKYLRAVKTKRNQSRKLIKSGKVIVVNVWPLGLIYKVYIPSNLENILEPSQSRPG